MEVAVIGCLVNSPGESKQANIVIRQPGTGEEPAALAFIDGKKAVTLRGKRIVQDSRNWSLVHGKLTGAALNPEAAMAG